MPKSSPQTSWLNCIFFQYRKFKVVARLSSASRYTSTPRKTTCRCVSLPWPNGKRIRRRHPIHPADGDKPCFRLYVSASTPSIAFPTRASRTRTRVLRFSAGLDHDLRGHRVGNVAGLVRAMMQGIELCRFGRGTDPVDLRPQAYLDHRRTPIRVLP